MLWKLGVLFVGFKPRVLGHHAVFGVERKDVHVQVVRLTVLNPEKIALGFLASFPHEAIVVDEFALGRAQCEVGRFLDVVLVDTDVDVVVPGDDVSVPSRAQQAAALQPVPGKNIGE